LSQKKKRKGKGPRKTDWTAKLIKAVWPQERDFLERPERYRYVRKLLPESNCVFCECEKAAVGPDSLVLVRDDLTMVVMNKFPYNTGHLLVMPREHIGQIWDLSEQVNARLAHWLRVSAKIVKQALNCHGFNMGLNHGAVAGAGIPDHLHWHIVPRWGGDTNFFPLIAEIKVLPATLEQTYEILRPHFQKEE
jgi:ATP adenylyltransferase